MNDACGSERHSDFPATVWVVVEQPPGEEYRLDYNPEDGTFRRSESRSLVYDCGFTGAYGWVERLGGPPDRHCDAILITRRALRPGDAVAAHPCGIFYRGDGDHKLVALPGARRRPQPPRAGARRRVRHHLPRPRCSSASWVCRPYPRCGW